MIESEEESEKAFKQVQQIYLRSHNAHTALSLWVTKTFNSTSTLIKRSQTCSEIGRITAIYEHKHTSTNLVYNLYFIIFAFMTEMATSHIPAGISARRPEISLRASAHREVESAIMLTL